MAVKRKGGSWPPAALSRLTQFDPQLPFEFLLSCPIAKPRLYALSILEAAIRGQRKHAICVSRRTAGLSNRSTPQERTAREWSVLHQLSESSRGAGAAIFRQSAQLSILPAAHAE